MHCFCIGLMLIPGSLSSMIPTIDTGMGSLLAGTAMDGPEAKITDFAILIEENLAELPESFTICSSTTSKAFAGRLIPFQLIQDNGRPWFTFIIMAPQKTTTKHRIIIMVRDYYTVLPLAWLRLIWYSQSNSYEGLLPIFFLI